MIRPTYETFDFRSPDYTSVFRWRAEFLAKLRADPQAMAMVKAHYRNAPWDFINDWGITFDPRNVNQGLPPTMPFVLFKRQVECLQFMHGQWQEGRPGLIEKSRDVGLSWLVVGLGCAMCVLNDDFVAGYGSRKEEYVDKLGHPKSLFYKARLFMKYLPREFRAGWSEATSPHMRLEFPETRSVITGEAGDNIGRGDRTSVYYVDESAYLERANLIEASLSATTNCRIDLSSVNGMGNVFAEKRHSGRVPTFVFDWRDDPRKDDEWYAKQCETLDPITIAQEIDRNYLASVEGQVIPGAWVQSAIDAHVKLGIEPTGDKFGAFDVADEGKDKCAWAGRHGVVLRHLKQWSGKDSDIFASTEKVFGLSDAEGYDNFRYDADGLGAGVDGATRVINERRAVKIKAEQFRGSGEVVDPDKQIKSIFGTQPKGDKSPARLNKDYFQNAKAQAWWELRLRFMLTHRAVTEGASFDPDEIISLSSDLPELHALQAELSRPTWDTNSAGKIIIDKAPEGQASPNLADAVMICYAPRPKRRGGFLAR